MLQFAKAKEVANKEGIQFVRKPENTSLSGADLGTLTNMVIHRFIEGVDWESVVSIYLNGLVDEADEKIIQRAVRALMEGGIAYA